MRIAYLLLLFLICISSPARAGNDDTITSLCKEGIELYRKNQLQEALQRFQKAENLPRETAKPYEWCAGTPYYTGMIYYRQGKAHYDEARKYLRFFQTEAKFYGPGMPRSQVIMGNMSWDEGDYIKAIEYYEEALAEDPFLPEKQELKDRITQLAFTPAEARPKRTELRRVYQGTDLCSVKKPDRYFRSVGKDGAMREFCTTVDGEVTGPELQIYLEDENGNLIGSMYKNNSEMEVYLVEGGKRTPVLQTRGHHLKFVPGAKKDMPDIEVLWETHTDATNYTATTWLGESHDYKTVYVWTGKKYEDRELGKATRINQEALALWRRGKAEAALARWGKGLGVARQPGYGLSASIELVNNFAFAMSQGHDDGDNAQYFLRYIITVDPKRWQAYLNLGDLFWRRGQKEKAVDFYLKTLIVHPEYRERVKLRDRIEKTEAGVASLHEVTTPVIDQRLTNYTITTVVAPYAERYAQATGTDIGRVLDALGMGRQAAKPKPLGERSVSPGRGEHFYSGTVRLFELLRAKLKDRTGDVFLVLYNNEQISDDWSEAYSVGWRLAVIGDDYRLQNIFDLYKISAGAKRESAWPEHPGIVTRLDIEAGVLHVEVQYAAYSRTYSTIAGYRYSFLPRQQTIVLQDVDWLETESGDDE